jgi:hypothetical protein
MNPQGGELISLNYRSYEQKESRMPLKSNWTCMNIHVILKDERAYKQVWKLMNYATGSKGCVHEHKPPNQERMKNTRKYHKSRNTL